MKYLLIFLISISNLIALTNLEVAQNSENAMSGFGDATSTMDMTLINAAGQKKIRSMKMQVLEGEDEDKSLMEFLTPADVKGTKFLSYEHVQKDDDQWLYLPALKRVKRIASKNKSGAFMGSEFSYEDLSAFNVKKYIYNEGDAPLKDGLYVILSKPVSKYSGYTKLISYIDKKTFLVQKMEYFDRKRELLKIAIFEDYKHFSDVYRIGKITMKNVQNDKTTILIWSNQKINTGLKSKNFHKRYLK
ncbi:outer membrane lipoprotein-sorting protein [Sulfurimonas sp. SAG-AH-194-C20]|nr:outer membrane lipoprotein-sorting protein [Sulfurimonas sp. SAG-AH-194-C20]MDF1878604.1 outer membrane lipoprotein-sorting protein [Sulfurimonas sp. SAG-AH-194-C20]